MQRHDITFVYPGDLNTRTGGYLYDKRVIEGLNHGTSNHRRQKISLLSLTGDYPFPSREQLADAALQLSKIADHSVVVMDGLAYSVMPEILAEHAQRLTFIALIHHPLALETGLDTQQAAQFKKLETQALHYASHVITTSKLTAHQLTDYGIDQSKVTAVLPGTDNFDLASGSQSDTTKLLCVATLTPRKGHKHLFDALATLNDLNWQLQCVGSTERDKHTYAALQNQSRRLKLNERIEFVGEVNDEELECYYHQADMFVLASFHEGYGMVLSEAIARGLPIVCTDAGATRQTVPAGAGLLVPPGDSQALADALRRCIGNPTVRIDLKAAAVVARKQLRSWHECVNEFSAVLATKHGING